MRCAWWARSSCCYCPRLAWADVVWVDAPRRLRWVVGLGLSYVLIICVMLLLHYLPGSVAMWAEVLALDGLVVSAAVIGAARAHHRPLVPVLAREIKRQPRA